MNKVIYPSYFILFILSILFATKTLTANNSVNSDSEGIAIHGYDPVAYFTEGKAIEGSPEYHYEWNDATWYFASHKNRELFKKNPKKYAPQYGGFCAYAVSYGSRADIDPKAWDIYKNKLYLNFNSEIKQKWQKEKDNFIKKANKNWKTLLDDEE